MWTTISNTDEPFLQNFEIEGLEPASEKCIYIALYNTSRAYLLRRYLEARGFQIIILKNGLDLR